MTVNARIIHSGAKMLLLEPFDEVDRELYRKQCKVAEIRLVDGREITALQRRKIFAIIKDIALWSGHEPEEIRGYLTWDFCLQTEREMFSLSNCDMTTAKEYINYLIEFCFRWDVPCRDRLLNRTDDIDRYLYLCLEYRRCAICGRPADVHHVDRIGMGGNRDEVAHLGRRAVALCREHHCEAHRDQRGLFEGYHIFGIRLDEYLCSKLNLRQVRENGK